MRNDERRVLEMKLDQDAILAAAMGYDNKYRVVVHSVDGNTDYSSHGSYEAAVRKAEQHRRSRQVDQSGRIEYILIERNGAELHRI